MEFHNKDEDVHLSFHFELDQSKFEQHAYLNTSLAIYDSTDQELLDYCETEWFQIGKDHPKLDARLDAYAISNYTSDLIIQVEGCEGMQEELHSQREEDEYAAMIGGKGQSAKE